MSLPLIKILNKNHLEDEELPYELFLATRKITKITNAFANNMWTEQKKPLANVAVPLATSNLTGLVSNFTSNPRTKFEGKINVKL